ncbi:hypothetical protein PZH42_27950, partial [Bacteroides cellulosilyticus]|nr:hypothetical protein [Bacteroides cellulosilyticus]
MQNNGIEGTTREMYIRQGDAFTQISGKDILYVEGMQNYLKLHFKSKTLIIHQTMTSLEEIHDIVFSLFTHLGALFPVIQAAATLFGYIEGIKGFVM